MTADYDPLVAPPPDEVLLRDAPLVRVIAQIRFSLTPQVQQFDAIAPFQESIRSDYPVLRQELTQRMVLGPQGIAPGPKETTWRFCAMDGAWRVSLASEFLALETTSYTSRSDFLNRFDVVVRALEAHPQPALVERIGLRYIDRVEGDDLENIDQLVRKEMLGLSATALSTHVQHAIGDTLLKTQNSKERLRVRWGRLPPQVTVDPHAIEPIAEPSWILDLDMFSAEERPFSAESILADTRRYAERLYTMFRWAVTDEFLHRYGGQP